MRHRLAQSGFVLGALFMLACGASHSTSDSGVSDSGPTDSGADTGLADSGPTDSGADTGPRDSGAADSGVHGLCDPEDARAEICPELLCDGPSSWHWDGEHCFVIDCGACLGSDCDSAVFSQAECQAAHASCEASLCRDTGGTWAWWLPVCTPYQCGVGSFGDCDPASPHCDCGIDSNFVPGVGCQVDPACPEPTVMTDERLCTSTGGTFDASCCHTECGIPCAAACAAPACDCGSLGIFDPDRGCIVGRQCLERELGESCTGDARCADGTLCCDDCGGAGCAGHPTCRVPVCSADPAIDTCGNNSLAP